MHFVFEWANRNSNLAHLLNTETYSTWWCQGKRTFTAIHQHPHIPDAEENVLYKIAEQSGTTSTHKLSRTFRVSHETIYGGLSKKNSTLLIFRDDVEYHPSQLQCTDSQFHSFVIFTLKGKFSSESIINEYSQWTSIGRYQSSCYEMISTSENIFF